MLRPFAQIVAVCLPLLFSACGESHTIDDKAWRSDVEAAAGYSVDDWEGYRALWTDMCDEKEDPDDWGTTIAVFVDGGDSVSEMEMNVEHACPESDLEDFRDAAKDAQDTSREFDEVCAMDPSLRTSDQAAMAEWADC